MRSIAIVELQNYRAEKGQQQQQQNHQRTQESKSHLLLTNNHHHDSPLPKKVHAKKGLGFHPINERRTKHFGAKKAILYLLVSSPEAASPSPSPSHSNEPLKKLDEQARALKSLEGAVHAQ